MGGRKAQKDFARAVVFDGCSYAEAYKRYYNCEGMDCFQIAKNAHSISKSKAVKNEIAKLKKEFEKDEIITRHDLLEKVKKLIDDAEKNTYILYVKGEPVDAFNTKAADILIKAIDRAAKLIGADEPEKVDSVVTVTFDGDFGEYAN